MNICPSCRQNLPAKSKFCPSCGTDQTLIPSADADLTMAVPPAFPHSADTASPADQTVATGQPANTGMSPATGYTGPGSQFGTNDRFIPGTMVADRYRIVGLLGRGGMGEVYRADDLKLGQPVALKFLPPGLETDPDRLQRFLSEVRTARQVTHPNVCRVYDIDEVDGQHFLSMEYVDGEDLSSLLLRIGRLPQERAVDVSRQICAGLAAAHEKGIVHRDLKPANVMIDGRGKVRLTDFGLASLAEDIDETEIKIGTPAYMAPEQIAGKEVTTRSDIYSLGLVLYEIFTGRRTFPSDNAAEMRNLHATAMPTSLTQYVQDLDPAVERAVMRCLEKDPANRPATALAISAALPGGDPLAAALAAGETPSPELLAEVGQRQGLAPAKAILMAMLAMLLIVGGTRWAGTMSVNELLPLDRRPEVLEDLARGMIVELGYTEEAYSDPADHAWGMLPWASVFQEISAADTTGTPWKMLKSRPDAASYWYRQSPSVLLPDPTNLPIFQRGPVTVSNPSPAVGGEVIVLLDLAGHLRRFQVMPTRFSTALTIEEVDWSVLFDMAGLDMTRFTKAQPRYQRFLAPDRRHAWQGTLSERPTDIIWVEAGSYESRPVLFNVSTKASIISLGDAPQRQRPSFLDKLNFGLQPLLMVLIVFVSFRTARNNKRLGRSDNRGAMRFSILIAVLFALGTALDSHSLFTFRWADEIWPIVVGATFLGMAAWGLYSAAEPMGRQVWPTMFISSSRLLSRPRMQWLDPLLGQSVLIGMLGAGVDFLIRGPLYRVVLPLLTGEPTWFWTINIINVHGQREALANVTNQALLVTFLFVLVMALIIIRRLVRNVPLTLILTVILWSFFFGVQGLESFLLQMISATIMLVILLRWGIVAMVVSRMVWGLMWDSRAADWSAWHSQGAVLILVVLAALAAYGAWAAIGSSGRGQTR